MMPDETFRRLRWAAPLLGLALAAAACGGDAEQAVGAGQPEYEGLTRDQIENQAESMSPEEAEALGIVDTAIRIGPPMDPDSVVPLDGPAVIPDTVQR